jgi:hypothetical protein
MSTDDKAIDVSEIKPCALCKGGVVHSGNPMFYELTMSSVIVDADSVRRLQGLEMMMGGNAAVARALSPSNTVAHRLGEPTRHFICIDCALRESVEPALFMGDNPRG